MKTLCLLRHAKSDWGDTSLADFDRPLNKRGRTAAERIGRWLNERGGPIDLVLCSAAKRARETWHRVAGQLTNAPTAKFSRELYQASSARLLRHLCDAARAAGDADRVLLIGHNPEIAETAARLAGPGSEPAQLVEMQCKYPSGALAVFACDIADWGDLDWERGQLTDFVRPRDLG